MGTAAPGRTLGCRVRLTKWRIYETENTLRLDYRFCDVFDAFGRPRSAPFFRGLYSALGRGIFNGQGHDFAYFHAELHCLRRIPAGNREACRSVRTADHFISQHASGRLEHLFTYLVTSPWQLFILYGIIVSLGVGGASNVASTVIVTNWFNEKRGLAFGIMEAGFGAGQMLLVPGSLMLIHWFNWQVTVIVLGLFLAVIVFPIVILLLRNHPSEKNVQPIGGTQGGEIKEEPDAQPKMIPYKAVFLKRTFWFLVLPFFICGFTTTGLMDTHLIPFSHDHGFSTEVTSAAVSLLAGFNIIGILISGVVADRWSSRKILCFLYAVRALSLVILLSSHNSVLLLCFAVLFGLVDFATVAPTQMLATQYFRQYSVGFILGWLFLSHQLGSALGAYLPGVWYSQTGNYNLSFYLSIVILAAASILNILLPEPKK